MPSTEKNPSPDILVTLRIPRTVHAQLTKEAKTADMTLAAVIRRALKLRKPGLTQ
jgi:predicted HicB family RNase H-like nuclease